MLERASVGLLWLAAGLFLVFGLAAFVAPGWAGMFLIVPITLAALLSLSMFDFSGKPGGLLYLLAYVVVGVIIAVVLFYDRRKPEAFARSHEHPQPLT
jgi:predicted exporter